VSRARLIRIATAAILGIVAFAAVLVAQRDQGLVRDEIVYMNHGTRYADWWIDLATGADGTLTEKAITAHFGGTAATANNREHPPLMKTLFGFSDKVLHGGLGWTSRITAYRAPAALMNAALVVMVFLFAASIWGYAAGLIAAVLTLLLPRAFFHAGLATFDAAIVTVWFATLVAYHRALRSRWWILGAGICFGLTLTTKHNAIVLPVALIVHYLYTAARAGRAGGPWHPRALGRGLLRWQSLVVPATVAIGALVLVALWPWLWFDTLDHAGDWIGFHLEHVHYNYEYLGENWNAPPYPWHVPIVTTLLTVPVVTLAAALFGALVLLDRAGRGRAAEPERAPALLLFLSAGVSMGPFILTTTPIFGAEKHWAPAIPTICIFAGVGLVTAARLAVERLVAVGFLAQARARVATVAATAALGTLAACAALAETAGAHPYALSHYNALAGGTPGGADLGMNRQFWGYSARGVLPFLNQHAPAPGQPPRPVYSHDASPAWGMYREAGFLAPGLPDAGHEEGGVRRSKLALVVHEKHFNRHDYLIWRVYGTTRPVFVLTEDGVPLVTVYARPELADAIETE
jgi:hypothetical protein